MKPHFSFSRLDCAFLVANLLSFGAGLVLLAFKGANGPLVLLTVGAGFAAVGKLSASYQRS